MKSDEKYYSLSLLLSYNAVYNFAVGGRGIGKTYDAVKRSIKAAIKKGHEFILLRRYKEELVAAKQTFFENVKHEFPNYEFRTMGKLAQYADALPEDFDELPAKEQKEIMKAREWITIGYFIALSTSQREKGTAYPRVMTIIFDEFVIENAQHLQYLKMEHELFNNFYSTVARKREGVRVYFLANSVSIDNPYFIAYNITPDDQANKGIIVKAGGFIAVHFPDSREFENLYHNRFSKFIREETPEYAAYAIDNTFRDNHKLMIEAKPSDAEYVFSIETLKGTFSVWNKFMDEKVYIQKKAPKSPRVFTTIPNKMSENKIFLENSHDVLAGLRTAWRRGRMRFDAPQTRIAMQDIFIK